MSERLDFIPLREIDYGGTLAYYVRGHVEVQRFVDEYRLEMQEEANPQFVRETWWRWVPAYDGEGYRVSRQYGAKPGSPGAFKVTVYDKQEQNIVEAQARIEAGRP